MFCLLLWDIGKGRVSAMRSETDDLTLRLGDAFLDAAGEAGIPKECLLNGGLNGRFHDGFRAFLNAWYGTSYRVRVNFNTPPEHWHRRYEPVLPAGPRLVVHSPAALVLDSAFHVFPVTHVMTQEEGKAEIAARYLRLPEAEYLLQAITEHAPVGEIRQLVLFGLELDPAPPAPYTVWMGGRNGAMRLSSMPITMELKPGMHLAGIPG